MFEILVILWGRYNTFWDMALFIYKSLVCGFLAHAEYTCCSKGKTFNDCANFDTFMKLGMVEDNHLRIGQST